MVDCKYGDALLMGRRHVYVGVDILIRPLLLLILFSVMYLDDEKTEGVIDWENPAAARALTQTLLAHDFGLQWDIPIERLCPPVSLSIYILFLCLPCLTD